MTGIERVVQMLNVRAPDSATAQQVTTLLEEALRMATSSGDIPGKVLVIKSLDLDAIPRAGSQVAVARAVDAAVERVVSNAVRGDDPAASDAPMVYFADEADVVQSLAERVANNKPATEWFWPSIVKGWTPNPPTERAIALLIERAAATPGGVVTLAHVVETLASTGVLDKLLERISAADGRAMLEAIGWKETTGEPPKSGGGPGGIATTSMRPETSQSHDAERLAPHLPLRAQTLVQRWIARWGGDVRDPRALWLGAMLLVADRPARSANAQLPEVVRLWLASVAEGAATETNGEPGAGLRNDAVRQALQRDDLIADARAWLQSHPRLPVNSLLGGGPPFLIAPRASTDAPGTVERREDNEDLERESLAPDHPPTWKTPRQTDFAGLPFLLPLLSQTGVGEIVARDHSLIDRDWPTALLLRLARRLGVPREDPSLAWLTGHPAAVAHADRALTAEVMRAARIRIRMRAGRTMRQLVHRAGSIVATESQVDVFLHRLPIDADIQRAELLDDPALVPWLARVVHFHFVDTVDINA